MASGKFMHDGCHAFIAPTDLLDSGHEAIVDYVARVLKDVPQDPVKQAVALYYAVRDDIRYDPYFHCHLPEHYRASNVLKRKGGFCVCKAGLLCAMGRAAKIPSRLHFMDVRNHLADPGLVRFLRSDVFVFHGITEFFLEEKWVKSTPVFDAEYCRKHHVPPLAFDGRKDAILHAYDEENNIKMAYVADRGVYADIPIDDIIKAQAEEYGEDFPQRWAMLADAGAYLLNKLKGL
ncbi:MAG: transglutaminase family protein [Desulfatitalea sp.]|nr:transglutaminase family protein [Desulfatitalea sp.]